MKNATEKEKKILKILDDKYTSDQETDSEDVSPTSGSRLVIRRFPWRNENLTKLFPRLTIVCPKKKDVTSTVKVRRFVKIQKEGLHQNIHFGQLYYRLPQMSLMMMIQWKHQHHLPLEADHHQVLMSAHKKVRVNHHMRIVY